MRLASSIAVLSAVVFAGCTLSTDPGNTVARIPIDCATLATSLAASDSSLTATASGLKFRDLAVGTGVTVAPLHLVTIHYSGCLTSGVKFDENTNVDQPLTFTPGLTPPQLIVGFEEGVIGMKVGGRRQLVIPPNLGYGTAGKGAIPPNATIVFTVDVVQVQ